MKAGIILILLVAGCGCLVFAPYVKTNFPFNTVEDSKLNKISDWSENNVTLCFVKMFHLERDQLCEMELMVYANTTPAADDTLYIIIISKQTYENRSTVDPSTITGAALLGFTHQYLQYPSAPSTLTAATTLALTAGYTYRINFMGRAGSGTALVTVPGDYYIVAWAEDLGASDGGDLEFDLKIKTSGQGDMLNTLFLVVGIGLVAVAAVLGIKSLKGR